MKKTALKSFVLLTGVWLAGAGVMAQAQSAPEQATGDQAQIAHGKYLTEAADCVVCHTGVGGKPFAGSLAFRTPFGTMYSSNITPDAETGIGNWTEQQFRDAVKRGIRNDGAHLYPSMPYTSYSKLSDDDVAAMWAYLRTVPAVHQVPTANDMGFPYNQRYAMLGWNLINFKDQPFAPDPAQDAHWNRGKYVAIALGHCEECHTPRNLAMGLSSKAYAGEIVDGWQAFNISSDDKAGIGSWSKDELKQYLATGALPGKATAAGPMADVISHSLRYLSPDDLDALATYIKSVPAQGGEDANRFAQGKPGDVVDSSVRGMPETDPPSGAQLFAGNCAACHGVSAQGNGAQRYYPSLFHNSAVGAARPNNLLKVMLEGVDRYNDKGEHVLMPAFADQLTDAQIASLANFVIDQYGNGHGVVSAEHVAKLRAGKVTVIPGAVLIGVPLALLLMVIAWLLLRRRKTH